MAIADDASYWNRIDAVRMSHACENPVQVTPGIGNQKLIGYAACGNCPGCRGWLTQHPDYPRREPMTEAQVEDDLAAARARRLQGDGVPYKVTADFSQVAEAIKLGMGMVETFRNLSKDAPKKEEPKPAGRYVGPDVAVVPDETSPQKFIITEYQLAAFQKLIGDELLQNEAFITKLGKVVGEYLERPDE